VTGVARSRCRTSSLSRSFCQSYIWEGIGAPRNTPSEVIDKLNHEINAVLADADYQGAICRSGGEPLVMTPVDFGNYIAAEVEKWSKVIRAANMKPE
jgi:tripartite-type tricarboxylate transporter receptor subunit TctC